MRRKGPVLLATADPVLAAELAQVKGVAFHLAGCETVDECMDQAAAQPFDVIVVAPALAPWPGALAAAAGQLRTRFPRAEVLVVAPHGQLAPSDAQLIRQTGATLLVLGAAPADDFAAWLRGAGGPEAPAPALPIAAGASMPPPRAALEPRTAPPQRQSPGWGIQQPVVPQAQVLRQKIAAFWSGKAGTGKSTLVTAVADTICRIPGVRVCAVDLHPSNSSLAPLLRMEAEPNSWHVLSEALRYGTLTAAAVRDAALAVNDQWYLITGPAGSDLWCSQLTPQAVTDLLDHLRADFDYILVDLPSGRTPVGDAALSIAQQVMLVVSSFFPDVLDTARVLDQAVVDGVITRERCRLILSAWEDSAELPESDVSGCLEVPVAVKVPLAAGPAMAAARSGRPITQLGTGDARRMADAAAAVATLVAETGLARPHRRNWFGR